MYLNFIQTRDLTNIYIISDIRYRYITEHTEVGFNTGIQMFISKYVNVNIKRTFLKLLS